MAASAAYRQTLTRTCVIRIAVPVAIDGSLQIDVVRNDDDLPGPNVRRSRDRHARVDGERTGESVSAGIEDAVCRDSDVVAGSGAGGGRDREERHEQAAKQERGKDAQKETVLGASGAPRSPGDRL